MRKRLISMLMLLLFTLLIAGCGSDNADDPDIAAAETPGETSDTIGGGVSPSVDGVEQDEVPLQPETASETPVESSGGTPATNAATETPGNEDAAAEEKTPAQDRQDEDSDADENTDEPQETQQPDASPAEDDDEPPLSEVPADNSSDELPDTQPDEPPAAPQTPEAPPAPEAVIGMWKPVDINWQGNEEENAAAAMLSDSLCIFSADGTFRLILPNSFLEFLQDDSDADLLFSITNGTWEKSGVASDGSAKYSLSIPALSSFGFGALNLQVVNGFLVFDDYDQMRLARYE